MRDDTKNGCVRQTIPVRGLTRFLTMAEVAETAKKAWSSLTVWQFFMKRAKEANIIATRISLDDGFRELKNAL